MSDERKLRLHQVAKELKVGQTTIIEFLNKKGVKVDNSPSTFIEANAYELLDKEFGGNKAQEKVNIRERISQKHETVSLGSREVSPNANEIEEPKEVMIKSSTISVKDEVASMSKPKILGKIDLDQHKYGTKPNSDNAKVASSESVREVPPAKVEPQSVPAAKPADMQAAVSSPKVTVDVQSNHTPKVEATTQKSVANENSDSKQNIAPKPAAEVKNDSKQDRQHADNKASEHKPKTDQKSEVKQVKAESQHDKPQVQSVQSAPTTSSVAEPIVIQSQTYDERQAADTNNLFRPNADNSKLSGVKVLGKIDVQSFQKKKAEDNNHKREKRKRITKDKVDINQKSAQGANKPGENRGAAGAGKPHGTHQGAGGTHTGGQGAGKPHGTNPAGGGAGGARPSFKDKKKAGNKPSTFAKPIVKAEVSEEDVQKQIKDTLARLTSKGSKFKTSKYRKDKRDAVSARMSEEMERAEQDKSVLKVTEFVTVSELASMMDVGVTDVIMACMNLGLMVSINQRLDAEALVVVAEEFGYKVEFVAVEIQEAIDNEVDSDEDLVSRPPIVTVMGHVDHGKTSLLDNIRKTNVIAGEAGGITQHIGAYSVDHDGRRVTFLDTPGHEAFTAMRARGAKITDVAIIIVAADDSVMPQTIEAINHAAAASVPMVFAINKIDKPGANAEKIKEQLANMNYLVEDWGGKYQSQEVSAKQGLNLDKLLEKVLLEAEFLDLKANPNRKASGAVIESTLDKGRGYVATVLVQNGTLRVGDVMLSGTYSGRVKAMYNERGARIDVAPPSTPVLVLGLNGAPQAGDSFNIMDDDRAARDIANKREQLQRMQGLRTQKHVTLDEIGRRIAIGNFKELNIIIKGDVDGSIEAMADSLIKLSKEEVQVNVIHKAVGPISESDVLLAAASNAVIVGFQVRPSASSRRLAEKEEIEIRLYSIIYDAINDIKDAIDGMLAPVMKEEIVCSVEVMEVFKITKVGTVAGCLVREGKITRNTNIRIIRDGIVVYTGKLGSLKRFKDDVKEVPNGMECGLNIDNYNDVRVGDIIEGYEQVEVKRK